MRKCNEAEESVPNIRWGRAPSAAPPTRTSQAASSSLSASFWVGVTRATSEKMASNNQGKLDVFIVSSGYFVFLKTS